MNEILFSRFGEGPKVVKMGKDKALLYLTKVPCKAADYGIMIAPSVLQSSSAPLDPGVALYKIQ